MSTVMVLVNRGCILMTSLPFSDWMEKLKDAKSKVGVCVCVWSLLCH